ncbi:MAG TPA: PqqD family protein [Thermoanaerobaculia bacterium]|nr:PqqD family protein [Thermoanaerobaculia bacterium]
MKSPALAPETRIARRDRVVWRELDGEAVLLDLESEVYFGLDDVGTRIWSLLEADRPLGEVHRRLLAEYDVGSEEAWRDLAGLVERLLAAGLVESRPPP